MKKHSRGGMIVSTCTIMSNLPLLRWSAPTTATGNASLSPAHWSAFSQQTNRPLAGSQEEHCESTSGTQGMPVCKRTLNQEKNFLSRLKKDILKELNLDCIDYMSEDPVGSDSFGQCYCTRYHGIDVMAKKLSHNNSREEKRKSKEKCYLRGRNY